MDFDSVLLMLAALGPAVKWSLVVLGSFVVIGTGIDSVIPDEKDGGFMKKLYAVPLLGLLLKAMAKFSPFNVRE